MAEDDVRLYAEFTHLKKDNPALRTFISIGGWDAGGAVFSSMASTPDNRAAFISSLMAFLRTYAFDGVDLDWEYAGASDRGGDVVDFENYVLFLEELRAAFGTKYGITAALPSSYWYMQGFDIVNMEQYVDWFNIMTYDIHGTWDGTNPFTAAVVQAHTNLTEINQAMDLLWRNNIDPSKVVLGLGFYGRSFRLEDPECVEPGCPFYGDASEGNCTATSGILSNAEIQQIITDNTLTPTLDESAAVKYITWNTDQWVSYDDAETFSMKMDYANRMCLGGVMVWALDLDSVGTDVSVDSLSTLGKEDKTAEMKKAVIRGNALSLGLFWTICQPPGTSPPCPVGYEEKATGHGKVFDADLQHNTGEGCHGGGVKGFQRTLCAANNVIFSSLQWGPGSISKACNSKCPDGWVTISKNSHIAGQKSGCKSGRYAPLCAYDVRAIQHAGACYSSAGSVIFSGGYAMRKDAERISGFDMQGDTKKRSFFAGDGCGGALPLGAIALDIPAAFRLETDHGTILHLEPTSIERRPSSTPKPTIITTETKEVTTYPMVFRTCNGARYPQACFHYSSVAQFKNYVTPTCSNSEKSKAYRPLPNLWNNAHKNKEWYKYLPYNYVDPSWGTTTMSCQRDEWPPNHFQQGNPDGWVRYLPALQNGPAANVADGGWQGICKFPPKKSVNKNGGPIVDMGAYCIVTSYITTTVTLNIMSYTWKNLRPAVGDPYGLGANICRPSVLTSDVGFALLPNDWWYTNTNAVVSKPYNLPPIVPPGARRPLYFHVGIKFGLVNGRMTVDEGNTTRLATNIELEQLGYSRCATVDCENELGTLRHQQADLGMATETSMEITSMATATSTLRQSDPTGLTIQTRLALSMRSAPLTVIAGSQSTGSITVVR
ncbi:hypothetical protein LTS10_009483 [Elasticomyces elasticus]|nr:hypothetical protein LTS10_009483 [Elasticomyces elasticus]